MLSNELVLDNDRRNHLRSDCQNCFGLCCVALPYTKSVDFACHKADGTPCSHLQSNYLCSIHQELRAKGFKGCTVYECFGAGQKVSQVTYEGQEWQKHSNRAQEMFAVFPIMQQLHEMLWYLNEALALEATQPIHSDIRACLEATEDLTNQQPEFILTLDVSEHRAKVNQILVQVSERVRSKISYKRSDEQINQRRDLIGAKLRGSKLQGANLRGALLIAADLRDADLRWSDFIGADLRDTDLSGADLTGSIFLTQAQVNAAKGNSKTKLPSALIYPAHWPKEA